VLNIWSNAIKGRHREFRRHGEWQGRSELRYGN
jgi:hypothetical protein